MGTQQRMNPAPQSPTFHYQHDIKLYLHQKNINYKYNLFNSRILFSYFNIIPYMTFSYLGRLLQFFFFTVIIQWNTAMAKDPVMNVETLCRKNPSCLVTLIARLPHAPFPYDGMVADTNQPFFDKMDPENNQRLHTVNDAVSYPESPYYQDNRVLIHLPPSFKPNKPFDILVFFHGHKTELVRTLIKEQALLQQVNNINRNLVLVAPQMVLNAQDSSPGKLYQSQGFANMLNDVSLVLGKKFGKRLAARFGKASVILSAFSGGYRAVSFVIDRGFFTKDERNQRLKGVILLDALYGETEKFADWLTDRDRQGFFVNFYGLSSTPLSQNLEQDTEKQGVVWQRSLQGNILPKEIYALSVDTPHQTIFLSGPPEWPLVDILKRTKQ
ncbi:MAG: hypothetical protein G8345_06315 [Magnetococcales bacterium]|nr:hypothetical protein [Magnetococcales bacterium]NGZ26484.1 hypothetical protein [Magnetococcales bacterium]